MTVQCACCARVMSCVVQRGARPRPPAPAREWPSRRRRARKRCPCCPCLTVPPCQRRPRTHAWPPGCHREGMRALPAPRAPPPHSLSASSRYPPAPTPSPPRPRPPPLPCHVQPRVPRGAGRGVLPHGRPPRLHLHRQQPQPARVGLGAAHAAVRPAQDAGGRAAGRVRHRVEQVRARQVGPRPGLGAGPGPRGWALGQGLGGEPLASPLGPALSANTSGGGRLRFPSLLFLSCCGAGQ